MAIIHKKFLRYISSVLRDSVEHRAPAFIYDPLYALVCRYYDSSVNPVKCPISEKKLEAAVNFSKETDIVGAVKSYLGESLINQFVDTETERKIIALKTGFPSLPATTCSTIINGFGENLSSQDILNIYASYGLIREMKELRNKFDFVELNRRITGFALILKDKSKQEEFIRRCNAVHFYEQAVSGQQESVIRQSGIKRSLFFHYWKRFSEYGLTGLADTGKEIFRNNKIGMENEAKIVITKLEYPERTNISFVDMLKTKGIKTTSSSISMIFKRWEIKKFKSEFIDNLKRLEIGPTEEKREKLHSSANPVRYVDQAYLGSLRGMNKYGMPTDSPGLFLLWTYIEKLGVFPVLEHMGLTVPENKKGYSWLDLLLLNIGRIFYGISSYSATCEHPEESIAFFAGLLQTPSNDSFLKGLGGKITEKQVYKLRQWLVQRAYDLGLIEMEKAAFDFHQIDMDVNFDRLRKFGKGPSPKKRICYNGFRPHIAWDIGTGCLIAAEFRKSSARGTTTAIPFVKDFIPSEIYDCFETIYVDSEYTGKNLWEFILAPDGINADITACLKQNKFVKKFRNRFLDKNKNNPGFWKFYDDKHVYTSKSFTLKWEKKTAKNDFKLKCVVKKNINNGKLRCFGTSKHQLNPTEILDDYSSRWVVENGIKDLITSYFLDNCPGTGPHLVDIHFLIVSMCRILYKMIELDMGKDIRNHDGTTKTMARMRNILFKQGAGTIFFKNGIFEIKFQNCYSPAMTKMLNRLFLKTGVAKGTRLELLGNQKLKLSMRIPFGEEHKNHLKKVPLSLAKNF